MAKPHNTLTAQSADAIAQSVQRKLSAASKASVSSPRGFVVPRLTGPEALYFMRSVGGFALTKADKTPGAKR